MKDIFLPFILSVIFLCSCTEEKLTIVPYPVIESNFSQHLNTLASKGKERIAGSKDEHEAATYIEAYFKSIGLVTSVETFPVKSFHDLGSYIEVKNSKGLLLNLKIKPLMYSISTSSGGITAPLVYAGLGRKEDFLSNAKDAIVLVERGSIYLREKAKNAFLAGAKACLIYDPRHDEFQGTLTESIQIPTLIINRTLGEDLKKALMNNSTIKVKIASTTKEELSFSQNVIAKKVGLTNTKLKPLLLSAHMDSVLTDGAGDNASGLAVLLESARLLSNLDLQRNVWFIAFGAEEIGTLGAMHFVQTQRITDFSGIINIDTVGELSPLFIFTLSGYANPLSAKTAHVAKELNEEFYEGQSSASDHWPFENEGLNGVFIMRGKEKYLHTDEDTIDNVSLSALFKTTNLVCNTVHSYKE